MSPSPVCRSETFDFDFVGQEGWTAEMSAIIKLLPGVLAAIVGFLALWLMEVLDVQSRLLELVLFLITYVVVAVLADKAMKAYGTERR